MHTKTAFIQSLMILSIAGCATGKVVTSLDDMKDDGESNIALFTYDLNVYTTEKHSSVNEVTLVFRCPAPGDRLKPACFRVELPYLGTKEVDGFGLNAFEVSGARAIKMDYDNYSLETASYSVITERTPVTNCYVSKKTKKTVCDTTMKDDIERHTVRFPGPIPVRVGPGSACYIGHMSLTVADDRTLDYNLDTQATLTSGRLESLPDEIADELIRTVDRPC